MRLLASLLALSLTAPAMAEKFKTEHSDHIFISPFFDMVKTENSEGMINNKDTKLGFGLDLGYKDSEKWSYRLRAEKITIEQADFTGDIDGVSLGLDAMYFLQKNTYLYGGVRNVKLQVSEFGPAIGIGHHFDVNDDWKVRLEAGVMKDFGSDFTMTSVNLGVTYRFGSRDKYKSTKERGTVTVKDKFVTVKLDVKFDNDSSVIKGEYMSEIKRVADFLNTYPNTKATFEGHTSAVGTNEYNMSLSDRRAKAIRAELIKTFNISPDRLFAEGFGEEKLLNSSHTAEAHKMNRRVMAILESTDKIRVN